MNALDIMYADGQTTKDLLAKRLAAAEIADSMQHFSLFNASDLSRLGNISSHHHSPIVLDTTLEKRPPRRMLAIEMKERTVNILQS